MKIIRFVLFLFFVVSIFSSCNQDGDIASEAEVIPIDIDLSNTPGIDVTFDGAIDLENLANYEDQEVPNYIREDNTPGQNEISDEVATLGRVLFYDKKLSSNNTISCASCHKQELAFGDDLRQSEGVNGETGRHSMRLINARFAEETRFFWDERALTLEEQTTMPIQDHIEMGFSGQDGDLGISDLIVKLEQEEYYDELFTFAFGTEEITEVRMQNALAQFVRSIQSFDSKYDLGRAQANNPNQDFTNFTEQENLGKRLYSQNSQFQGNGGVRIGGGLGCQNCHRAPEFDIDDNSRNNGVINTAGDVNGRDITVERSPSLRDLFNGQGVLNGPLMHTGRFDIEMMIEHYNEIDANNNPNLDNRLRRGGGQNLNMTQEEKDALVAFLKTLSGQDVYTNEKWSDPFR